MPVPKQINGTTIFVMTEEEKKQDIIRKLKKQTEQGAESDPEQTSEVLDLLKQIDAKLDKLLTREGGNQ